MLNDPIWPAIGGMNAVHGMIAVHGFIASNTFADKGSSNVGMVGLRALVWKQCYAPGESKTRAMAESTVGNRTPDAMNIWADGALPLETDDGDTRDQIAHLEAQLDELADAMMRCRKIRLMSLVAIVGGGVWLLAVTVGAIGSDPVGLMAAMSAVIGGTVMFGSNTTTTREVEAAIKNVEAKRAALIDLGES
jgi:hypothetical protein